MLLRLLGIIRPGSRARALFQLPGLCGTRASSADSIDLLARERGGHVEVDRSTTLNWDGTAPKIRHDGMRNSNCVAIAPTATISNIVGRGCVHRTLLRQPVGEIQPVGRVHRQSTKRW